MRGFQPYRAGEEMRHALPPGAFAMDPAYAYHPAFLQHHPYSHPAYRYVVDFIGGVGFCFRGWDVSDTGIIINKNVLCVSLNKPL